MWSIKMMFFLLQDLIINYFILFPIELKKPHLRCISAYVVLLVLLGFSI